jgi:hypothetical protein
MKKMFKHLNLVFLLLVTVGCATSKKMNSEKLNFITFDLRSYDIMKSDAGWAACESSYLKANKGKDLDSVWKAGVTKEDSDVCAMYRCDEKGCSNGGNYLAFSEVINFLVKKDKKLQYTSQKATNVYNIETAQTGCFKTGEVNSCAILSAYYRYTSYNRKEFYKVRTRECELLGISQKNCSFDL